MCFGDISKLMMYLSRDVIITVLTVRFHLAISLVTNKLIGVEVYLIR